jgi:signal transduction histidine kinase
MLFLFKKSFQELDENIKVRNYDHHQQKRLKFAFMVIYQSFLVGVIFFPINYFFGGIKLALFAMVLAFTTLLCLNSIKKLFLENESILLFITIANGLVFFTSYMSGLNVGFQIFFCLAFPLPFLMFEDKRKSYIAYSTILPMVLAATLYILPDYKEPIFFNNSLNPKYLQMLILLTVVSLIAYLFYYLHKLNLNYEALIIQQNQNLIDSEKMSSLGILSAGLAHEIRNPLTVILLQTQNMLMGCKEESEKQKLNKIVFSCERIVKIMDSMTTYSRQSVNDDSERVNILKVVNQAITLCNENLKGISLTCHIDEGLYAKTSSSELMQVLVNLINNSCDAIRESHSPWIKIISENKSNDLLIKVIDSGFGISSTVAKNIFTPFFTTKKVGQGTGLGLAVSFKLISSRGGQLNYISEEKNTTFVIKIPAA